GTLARRLDPALPHRASLPGPAPDLHGDSSPGQFNCSGSLLSAYSHAGAARRGPAAPLADASPGALLGHRRRGRFGLARLAGRPVPLLPPARADAVLSVCFRAAGADRAAPDAAAPAGVSGQPGGPRWQRLAGSRGPLPPCRESGIAPLRVDRDPSRRVAAD